MIPLCRTWVRAKINTVKDTAGKPCDLNRSWLTTHTADDYMSAIPPLEIENKQLLTRGAEAEISTGSFLGYDVIIKHRSKKKYREPKIDLLLRKNRTVQEVRLLNQAAKIGVKVPLVLDIDKSEWIIVLHRIFGDVIKDVINSDYEELENLFIDIGKDMGKLHTHNIIHGDLTTSNLILDNNGDLWFIDFGLGYISTQIEDKAVDLLVLKHTLRSSHFTTYKLTWSSFLKGYNQIYSSHKSVQKRMEIVEDRIRYSH